MRVKYEKWTKFLEIVLKKIRENYEVFLTFQLDFMKWIAKIRNFSEKANAGRKEVNNFNENLSSYSIRNS